MFLARRQSPRSARWRSSRCASARRCRSILCLSWSASAWHHAPPSRPRIHEGGAWIDCARHAAEAIPEGQAIAGPAVIEGYTATTYVPPGWTASIDAADNMILRRRPWKEPDDEREAPIDYAVISQAAMRGGARRMGAKLIRSAYSTILREARDGSAGLMDRHGNTVAQAELISDATAGAYRHDLGAPASSAIDRDAQGKATS